MAAGRDDDMLGGKSLSCDFDRLRPDETRVAAQDVHLIGCEAGCVALIQILYVSVTAVLQRGPVECMRSDREPVVGRLLKRVCDVGGVPHDLLRHAADVYAGTAQPPA